MRHAVTGPALASWVLVLTLPWPTARADNPPPRCPEELSCAHARQQVNDSRNELARWQKELAAHRDLDLDKQTLLQKISTVAGLAQCSHCSKRLRSEAMQVQAGMHGVMASHFDPWGMKRGEDGRRSFHAARDATRADPDNLAAWTSYGRALVAIDGKSMRGRIARYLKIDLETEKEEAATNLRRLLGQPPATDGHAAQAVLDDLTKRSRRAAAR